MSFIQFEIRPGAYYDSVVLMQLQRSLADLPGVEDAGVVMGTAANQEILEAGGLFPAGAESADSNDLLIVVKADSEPAAQEALTQVNPLLERRRTTTAQRYRPRSLAAAAKQMPQANWVLVSVPGRYAARVAHEALDLGKHVFLYSDNVSPADEAALKEKASGRGLLVMGPDCGTAIVGGVGLGFANRVRPGVIGLVGASGTGLQAVTSRIHNLGGGVSQAIGTGGRDLKGEIGAVTAQQGLDILARDPATEVIVLVSKPPSPAVAARLLQAAQAVDKPVVVNFLGYPPPAPQLGNLHFAAGLDQAAALAVALQGGDAPAGLPAHQPVSGYVRGLFSGGTLAYEALLGLSATVYPLFSNVPLREEQRLADPLTSRAHTILDLGEDVFTQGRLHPMMDHELRLRRLRQEAGDPEVALILLDVVLGEGAHADPAGALASVIAEVKGRRPLTVVALVVGTDEDPQDRPGQIERLEAAGAVVFTEVAEAVAYVSRCLSRPPDSLARPVDLGTLRPPLAAINVGLESFTDSLLGQGAEVVQVDWRPPAGGNERLLALLDRL